MSGSWGAETFDRLYAASDDPWRFETSPYEQAKYAATLAALPAGRAHAAFEAGCSIGVLTRGLAARCDSLLAVDLSAAALARAEARCRDLAWVRFARMALPHEWPGSDIFDLMLFSEVLYFLDAADIRLAADRTRTSLAPGGAVILVNWTGETDTPTTGREAADLFIKHSGLLAGVRQDHAQYRLDVLS